tara:strand:- start:6087 stop:11471 length:5385 start_codon:yes stop_codon:yes gene_type:complete
MAVNRYNKPAELNLMQTYVPLPFQEMAAGAMAIQKRHDQGELVAETLEDSLLGIKAGRPIDKYVVDNYTGDLRNKISGLIEKHNGRYADMLPDLKMLQRQIKSDLSSGQIADIVASGPEVTKYTDAIIKARDNKDTKFDDQLNQQLGAGSEYYDWYNEGMKNIGSEDDPNFVVDTDYYSSNIEGKSLDRYQYTGLHIPANWNKELDTIFGKVKSDKVSSTTTNKDGTTVSVEVDEISKSKIAQATLDNMSILSYDMREELALWSGNLEPSQVIDYAEGFFKDLLGDQMEAARQGGNQENITQLNDVFTEYMDGLIVEDGEGGWTLSPEAYHYAEAYSVNQRGQKYLKGDQIIEQDFEKGSKTYGRNDGNYVNIITSSGAGVVYGKTKAQDGDLLMDSKDSKIIKDYSVLQHQYFTQYNDAIDELNRFKKEDIGTVDYDEHIEELQGRVDQTKFLYFANAYNIQRQLQQAANNLGWNREAMFEYSAYHKDPNGEYDFNTPSKNQDYYGYLYNAPNGFGVDVPNAAMTKQDYDAIYPDTIPPPDYITMQQRLNNSTANQHVHEFFGEGLNVTSPAPILGGIPGYPAGSGTQTSQGLYNWDLSKALSGGVGRIAWGPDGKPLSADDPRVMQWMEGRLGDYQNDRVSSSGQFGSEFNPENNQFQDAPIVWQNPFLFDQYTNFTGHEQSSMDIELQKIFGQQKENMFGGKIRYTSLLSSTGNEKLDENIRNSVTQQFTEKDFIFYRANGDMMSMATDPADGVMVLADHIATIDGVTGQEAVNKFIENVTAGDTQIEWESVPNSQSGGYRGVLTVPVNSKKKTGKSSQIKLYFDAPTEYTNHVMNFGIDEDGFYGEMDEYSKLKKKLIYDAELELDRVLRVPGNVVPSSHKDANGNSLGLFYFGHDKNGNELRNDQFLFYPNDQVLMEVKKGGEQVRADGMMYIDVDNHTEDLAKLIVLNDPAYSEQAKKILEIVPGAAEDPNENVSNIDFEYDTDSLKIQVNEPNIVITNDVPINKVEDPIIVKPNETVVVDDGDGNNVDDDAPISYDSRKDRLIKYGKEGDAVYEEGYTPNSMLESEASDDYMETGNINGYFDLLNEASHQLYHLGKLDPEGQTNFSEFSINNMIGFITQARMEAKSKLNNGEELNPAEQWFIDNDGKLSKGQEISLATAEIEKLETEDPTISKEDMEEQRVFAEEEKLRLEKELAEIIRKEQEIEIEEIDMSEDEEEEEDIVIETNTPKDPTEILEDIDKEVAQTQQEIESARVQKVEDARIKMDTLWEDIGTIDPDDPNAQVSPGAIIVDYPGAENAGVLMTDDYRMWNLDTGEQIDKDRNVIGEREYDRIRYLNENGEVVEVQFDEEDIDPSDDVIIDENGQIIKPDNKPPEINEDIEGGLDIAAPNQVAQGNNTFVTKVPNKNGSPGTEHSFNIKKGQVWFDDTNWVWTDYLVNRGGTLKVESMKMKKQLVDQIMMGERNFVGTSNNVLRNLLTGVPDSGFEMEDGIGTAKPMYWLDKHGQKKGEYNGNPFAAPDSDEYRGDNPWMAEGADYSLVWSDNYDPTIHNTDGSLKQSYIDKTSKIFGQFPNLGIVANKQMTLSDGSKGTIGELINKGLVSVQYLSSDKSNPMLAGQDHPGLFKTPYGDVFRSWDSQNRARVKYEEAKARGENPPHVAKPENAFHVAGQAFDVSQESGDYGVYLVDTTMAPSADLSNTDKTYKWKLSSVPSENHQVNILNLGDIVVDGARPWRKLEHHVMKKYITNLYDLNKKDGYSLAQLPSEWWHFAVGEVTNYGDLSLPKVLRNL